MADVPLIYHLIYHSGGLSMSVLNFNEIYSRVSRKMTAIKWLQKNNVERVLMDNFISSEQFIASLKSMATDQDYSCRRTLDILERLMLKITDGVHPEDWLKYIYQYS